MPETTMGRLNQPLKDSRGAIMVLGIFFACMMVGWMWMLVGLGDAMIWRDRSQEAADSMSYTSAAVQAQGMNLISFVNILMLILTAVYLLMSFVYNVLDIFHVLLGSNNDGGCGDSSCQARQNDATILSMVPYFEWLEPIASNWCNAANIVGRLHDGNTNGAPSNLSAGGIFGLYERKVMIPVLPVLSKFEDIISYGAPWAGELVGVYMSTQYKDWGQDRLGMPISATLIPATLTPGQAGNLMPAHKCKSCDEAEWEEKGVCKPKNCDAQDPGNCEPYDGGDKREGLPVGIPDSGFTAVCDYATSKVTSLASGMVSGLLPGPVGTVLGKLVGAVMGALGSHIVDSYCKTGSKGLFSSLDSPAISALRFATWVQDGGTDNKELCPNSASSLSGGWGGDAKDGCGGGPKQCDEVYQMKLLSGNHKGDQFWEDPKFAGGPHLVVDYAQNGNDWMQVWGLVYGGNHKNIEKAEKLVGVAGMDSNGSGTWNTVIPQTSESSFDLYFAQAEFYYDCGEAGKPLGWGDEECNKESNASYHMNWRARLRRLHGLSWGKDILGYAWNGSLGSTLDDKIKDGIQKIVGGPVSKAFNNKIAGSLASTATNQAFSKIKDYAGEQVGGIFNPASAIPDFIH